MPSPKEYEQNELSRVEKLLASGAIGIGQYIMMCVQIQTVVDNWI